MFNNASNETIFCQVVSSSSQVHHRKYFSGHVITMTRKNPWRRENLKPITVKNIKHIFWQNVTLLFKVQLIFMPVVYDTEKKKFFFYMTQPSSDIFQTSMSENVQKAPAKFPRKFCTQWFKKYSFEKIAVHRRYFLRNFLFTTDFPWKTYGSFSFTFLLFSKRYQKQTNPFSSYRPLKWITIFHENSFSEYGSN